MKQIGELIEGQSLMVIEPGLKVRAAAQQMSERNIGAVAVVEAGRLAGIFSERDLMARVVAEGLNPDDTPVNVVMSKELVVASPYENSGSRGVNAMADTAATRSGAVFVFR